MLKQASSRLLAGVGRLLRGSWSCRWGLAVTIVALCIFRLLTHAPEPGQSDGHYIWLFARSITFDHDIDFANDYAFCGDPRGRGGLGPTGHPDNPFYVGPAVVLAPVLWVVRRVTSLPPDAPLTERLACEGPLATHTLAVAPLLGALVVWLVYRIARRHANDPAAAVCAALLGLCSPLPAYASIFTSFSHVYDAFWAAVTVWASLRAAERPNASIRWLVAGLSVGIGLLQRPVSVVFGLVPALLAVKTLRKEPRRLVIALAALCGAALAVGLFPQLMIYRYLYGPALFIGAEKGSQFMQFRHAHPWLVLFAPHGGLFYSTPTAWVTAVGFAIGLRDKRTQTLCASLLAACTILVWISGASLDWTGSGAFGARRLTSLVPLMTTPTVLAVQRIGRWLRARPGRATAAFACAAVFPVAFTIVGATYAMGTQRIPTDTGSSQAVLYGNGEKAVWEALDDVGDLAILPAEMVFHWRYGLGMNVFRTATEPIYEGDYLGLHTPPAVLFLSDPTYLPLSNGFKLDNGGLTMTGRRATLVVSAQWPYATDITVNGRASKPTPVRIGLGGWLSTTWWGQATLDLQRHETTLKIPRDMFDSGLIELVFERDSDDGVVVIRTVHISDETHYR